MLGCKANSSLLSSPVEVNPYAIEKCYASYSYSNGYTYHCNFFVYPTLIFCGRLTSNVVRFDMARNSIHIHAPLSTFIIASISTCYANVLCTIAYYLLRVKSSRHKKNPLQIVRSTRGFGLLLGVPPSVPKVLGHLVANKLLDRRLLVLYAPCEHQIPKIGFAKLLVTSIR